MRKVCVILLAHPFTAVQEEAEELLQEKYNKKKE